MILVFGTHVYNENISSNFFHAFKILIFFFFLFLGGGGVQGVKNDP